MDALVDDIGARPQTFAADTGLVTTAGLQRHVQGLTKQSDEPVLRATLPWEGAFILPVRVLREPDGSWRMWYSSFGKRRAGNAEIPRGSLQVAVSRDGICWEKEPLGAFSLADGTATNLCAFDDGCPVDGATAIFVTPDDADPARRYKLIQYLPDYYLAASPDGIRWQRVRQAPVWPNGSGDGLEETAYFFRDPLLHRYRGYMRVWRRHQTIRKTGLGESDDLVHWSGPKIIWEAFPHYGVGSQIYGMNVHVDAGRYWAFPWIFYTEEPTDPALRMTMRLKLAASHDGIAWDALAPEMDAVPLGAPGAFDSGMMIAGCPPVLDEREGRLYYCGCNGAHDGSDTERAVGLATWRRGSLVTLRADHDGVLLTRRFLFRGNELHINAQTRSDGAIRAELLNDDGMVIKPFHAAASDPFTGDDTDHCLSWKGQRNLTSLFGQNLMLRLHLDHADIASFRAAGPPERFAAPLGPPPVRCGRCVAAPVVDGTLDEPCWQDFSRSGVAADFVTYAEVQPAITQTRALFTHDEDKLYMAVECAEPATDRLPRRRDAGPVNDLCEDLVEIRLSAPCHGEHVHQLMVTATGARQHGWFSKEAGGSRLLETSEWEACTAVLPGRWCIEMAVPFRALEAPSPAPGERWRLNIIRCRYVDGPEVSCWRCMFGSPHRTDLHGDLLFVD